MISAARTADSMVSVLADGVVLHSEQYERRPALWFGADQQVLQVKDGPDQQGFQVGAGQDRDVT